MAPELTRLDGAEELLENMKHAFLSGTPMLIEDVDFNLVSWLISETKKVGRLKKALSFYADIDKYAWQTSDGMVLESPTMKERGRIARKALETEGRL
jgi:hypothetical protein